jgi:hypothetical protein
MILDNLINSIKSNYRVNKNLKKEGLEFAFTPEIVQEYKKCRDDIIYFAEQYFMIVAEEGLVHIQLREYQKNILRSMRDNRYTIANQSRQSGKCASINTSIRIKNKKTGEILETTIGELYKNEKAKTLQDM